jgi:hypothetical protein
MSNLNQRQAQEAQQDFAREAETRQQMFTLHRDRRQQAHEATLQKDKLAAQTTEEQQRINAVAGGLYNYARTSLQNQASIEKQLRNTIPELRIGSDELPLDWTNRNEMMSWLIAGAAGGFTVAAARDVGAVNAATAEWYQTHTGGTLKPTSGDAAQTTLAQDQIRHSTVRDNINQLGNDLAVAKQEAVDLDASSADLSVSAYQEKAVAIAERLGRIAQQLGELRSGNNGVFLGAGASLSSEDDRLESSIQSAVSSLETNQRSKGKDAVGAWRPSDAAAFPGLMQGQGGDPRETAEFDYLLNSEPFKQHNTDWKKQLDWLINLSPKDRSFLDKSVGTLYNDAAGAATDLDDTQTFDLKHLLTLLRSQSALAKVPSAGTQASNATSSLIEGIYGLDTDKQARAIEVGHGNEGALRQLASFGASFDRPALLGFPLFPSDDVAQKALKLYGVQSQLGYMELPEGDARGEFIAKWVDSPEGQTHILDSLFESIVGDPDGVAVDDVVDQLQSKGKHALKALGLDTRGRKEKLNRAIESRTGGTRATFDPTGGAARQVHDYDFDTIEAIKPSANPFNNYGEALSDADFDQWQSDYVGTVFTSPLDRDITGSFIRDALTRFRASGEAFTQDQAWMLFTKGRYRGEEKRLRLQQEAASETEEVATFYDLFQYWSSEVPTFAQLASQPGRVGDRAVVGIGTFGHATYADWAAKGDAARMIRGDQSLARKYRRSTTDADRDENLLNMLGFVDFMRGYDLSRETRDLPPEKRSLLIGMQEHLRGLDLNGVTAAISDSPTGFNVGGAPPTGFSFADLGLAIGSPETAAALATPADKRTLRQRAIDIPLERAGIRKAKRDLNNAEPGEYLDIDTNSERVDYEIMSPELLEDERKRLTQAEEQLDLLEAAQNFPITLETNDIIVTVLTGEDFSTPAELADLLRKKLEYITALPTDQLALERAPLDPLLEMVANAPTMQHALKKALDVFAYSDLKRASAMAASLTSTAERDLRPAVIKEARMNLGEVDVKIKVLAEQIGRMVLADGKLDLNKIPLRLLQQLSHSNFKELAAKAGDPDANYTLATHLWSAHEELQR